MTPPGVHLMRADGEPVCETGPGSYAVTPLRELVDCQACLDRAARGDVPLATLASMYRRAMERIEQSRRRVPLGSD